VNGSFPSIGLHSSESEKKKDNDPCHGKPKEFFVYDCDPKTNACVCTAE